MKRYIRSKFIFILIFSWSSFVYADSPLTSTDIHNAYSDLNIVQIAKQKKKITKKIAKYLSSDTLNLGIKAAIINAVGWNIDGTNNADLYCKYIYEKPMKEIDMAELKNDDLFNIGYLQALDDYFHPQKALPYLKEALKLHDKSFTVAIVLALTKAQDIMGSGDWCEMWNITYKVLNDKSLIWDMREEAINIIKDYMILYKC